MTRRWTLSLVVGAVLSSAPARPEDLAAVAVDAEVRIRTGATFEVPGVASFGADVLSVRGKVLDSDASTFTVAPENREAVLLPKPAATLRGRVLAIDDASLTLELAGSGRRLQVPRGAIERLEVRDGTRSRGKQALRSAGIGAAAFAGLVLARATDDKCEGFEIFCGSPAAKAAAGALLGGWVGAVLGATQSTERWRTVPRDAFALAIRPARGEIGVAVAVRF